MEVLEFVLILSIVLIVGVVVICMFYFDYKYKEVNVCKHEWEEVDYMNVYESDSSKRPCCKKFVLKCKKCGDIKVVEITA